MSQPCRSLFLEDAPWSIYRWNNMIFTTHLQIGLQEKQRAYLCVCEHYASVCMFVCMERGSDIANWGKIEVYWWIRVKGTQVLVVCFLNFSGDCNCSHSKFIKMCTLSVYFFISVILQRKKQTRNLEERFKRFFFFSK